MTDEELRRKVIGHFTKIEVLPKCPMCAHDKWEVVGLAGIPIYKDAGGVYPALLAACAKCSFFATYSAKKMGIVP